MPKPLSPMKRRGAPAVPFLDKISDLLGTNHHIIGGGQDDVDGDVGDGINSGGGLVGGNSAGSATPPGSPGKSSAKGTGTTTTTTETDGFCSSFPLNE